MVQAALAKLARVLDGAGLPYIVVGGQAVLLYGEPRVTRDIDVTVAVGPDRAPELLALLTKAGWRALPERPEEFAQRHWVVPAEEPGGVRLDFIFGVTAFENDAAARARQVQVGETSVRFVAPDDLVVMKLFAGRPRDLEDARGILAKQKGLDLGYVRRWLQRFDRELGTDLEARLASL